MFKKAGGRRQCCRGVGSCGPHLQALPHCAWVPAAGPGHMVVQQAYKRLDTNQYHSLPCKSSGPWPRRPCPHTGESEGIGRSLRFGILPPSPGPRRLVLRMGMGGQPQLHPEAGRQAVPELRQLVDGDRLQGKNGPEPERCLEGRRILAERGGVGFDRKESTNLLFSNQQPPFSLMPRTPFPVGKLCPLGFLSVPSWLPVCGSAVHLGIPGALECREGTLSQEEQCSPLWLANPLK